jgi:hypothetical protein
MENLILQYYSSNKNKKKWKNNLKDILENDPLFLDYKSIKFRFLKSPSTYQVIWHVLEKDCKTHYCLECGIELLFNNKFFYPDYCSRSCTATGSRKKYSDEKMIEIINKRQKTNLEKYGEINAAKNPEVKRKRIETNLKRYGKENPMECSNVQEKQFEKMKKTNLEKYGVESTLSLDSTRKKYRSTMNIRYGVDSPWKNKDIKEKMENTTLEKYGDKSYAKTSNWMERFKNHEWGNRYYDYFLPSGKKIRIQGYEKYAIDYLLKNGYKEEDIKTGSKEKPFFKYNYLDKERIYKPDIYLEPDNLIIEVKSLFTYNLETSMNLEKEKSCVNNGFKFQFWIFDRKGNLEIISHF